MPVKVREAIRIVEADGWYHIGTKGDHRQYKPPMKPGKVTIPGAPRDELPPGTWNSIQRQPDSRKERAMHYLVVVEKAEHNYAAYVPDLPGCVSTGTTIEQTLENVREAITFHLEGMARDGESLPPRYTVLAASVEVPDYVPASRAAAD